jgi:hypothetical protein
VTPRDDQWADWAEAPPARRRSALSGLFGLTVISGAVWLSRRDDAWPRFLHYARPALAAAAVAGVAAVVWWAVRAWRAASRAARGLTLGLAVVAGGTAAWTAGGVWGRVTLCGLAVVLAAVVLGPRLRRDEPTQGDDPGQVPGWVAQVERDWPATARAAGLVHPDDPAVLAPLLQPPTEPAAGAVELLVGLRPVLRAPEDVRAAGETLRRRMGAQVLRVRPGDESGMDVAQVRAYRRHPMRVPVSWTDLAPLDDPSGEWVPVGVDEWGDPAVIRWRLPLLITGAQESGKTALIRAAVAGAAVQSTPVRWWIWDNRGDYRQLSGIAHRYASTWTQALAMLRELDCELDSLIASSPDLDSGYERTPRLSSPADVLIVGELRTALAGPGGKASGAVQSEVVRLLSRRAADGRALAHGTFATVQVSTKDEVGPIRDLFVQKALCRVESESLVDPALGSGALERGADAHRIPPELRGVTLLIDPLTKDPLYVRSAFVPAAQTEAAIVWPYRQLMGRHLEVIDGELG